MSGHTHIHTYIHTYIHTHTHDNYYNPRCAHAHRGLIILSFIASNMILIVIVTVAVPRARARACVRVCVSVRSFLPLRASISRNIGTYVFTVTRKTFYIGIIIVIFAENALFRSYGRRHLLAPNATNRS